MKLNLEIFTKFRVSVEEKQALNFTDIFKFLFTPDVCWEFFTKIVIIREKQSIFGRVLFRNSIAGF